MRQHGLAPKEAAIRAMDEITGAIIGITSVLMAVFVPAAFLGGIAGQLFRQFSLLSLLPRFSAWNAMTLKPVQCSLWLRPQKHEKNAFFRGFDTVFDKITDAYTAIVGFLVHNVAIMVIIWGLAIAGTYFAFTKIPTGILPNEDDGLIMLNAQLPDGASLQRTDATMKRVMDILKSTDGIAHISITPGNSIIDGAGPTMGCGFASLEPWERLEKGTKQGCDHGRTGGEVFGDSGRHCLSVFSAAYSGSRPKFRVGDVAGGQGRPRHTQIRAR